MDTIPIPDFACLRSPALCSLSTAAHSIICMCGGAISIHRRSWHPSWGGNAALIRTLHVEALPKLAPSIEQGCLCSARELAMEMYCNEDAIFDLDLLCSFTSAMQVPGALQTLEVLAIYPEGVFPFPPGPIELLVGALASGAAPFLRDLRLGGDALLGEEAIEALATMFESRAQSPVCRGLKVLRCDACVTGSSQLMRNLLPSVTELDFFFWKGDMNDPHQNHVASNGAPQLKKLDIFFWDEEGANTIVPPSVAMLESMPALESLAFDMNNQSSDHLAVLEPLILAMNRCVAFQWLQHLCLSRYRLENVGWDRVLCAITRVPHLISLKLIESDLSPANMATFSALLGQNAFATLQSLCFCYNRVIGDEGVERLVDGLLMPACRTRLTALGLNSVTMGDKGMAALASAVREGCFERLEALHLVGNSGVTSRGVCALARAVRASGRQKLSSLLRISIGGDRLDISEAAVVELASALMNKCPRMKNMFFCSKYDRKALQEKLLEIVRAAGYQHQVSLEYWSMHS